MSKNHKTFLLLLWLGFFVYLGIQHLPRFIDFDLLLNTGELSSIINDVNHINNNKINSWDEAIDLNDRALTLQKSNPILSEELYKKAIEKDANFYYAYNNLGILYSDNGRQQEAFDMYQKAIQIKPDYDRAYNNLGVWYHDNGDNDTAIKMYEKSISIKDTNPHPYDNIALILDLERGKTIAAIPYYEKALKFGTTNITVINRARELGL